MEDARALYEWRNDPLMRQQSRNTDAVPWEKHVAWLEQSLTMPTRRFYIAEQGGMPVGTVRADERDGVQELSWTVAPEARGRGIGKRMVLQFVQQVLPNASLLAGIKQGNAASESIARALNLSPIGPESPNDKSPNPVILWR